MTAERNCTILVHNENFGKSLPADLRTKLESKNVEEKIEALQEVILMTLNGIPLQGLLMHVIKFCLLEQDKTIKRLMHTFWEIVDKKDKNGKLLPQMILVCNHLQNDLQHANEYIRGSTCRLLCKIREVEILEQVVAQILTNLEHRHTYVRKNAVLTVWRVVECNANLIPDANERLERLLESEGNEHVLRNALIALMHVDLQRALNYVRSQLDNLAIWSTHLQLAALEVIRKSCRQLAVPKGIYLNAVYNLLNTSSNPVSYQAANTLLQLTNVQTVVKTSVNMLTKLLQSESDQNVKLIVLNRLLLLKGRYNLGGHVMDILRALSTPNNDVRRKVLNLVVDLTSTQNVDDVIGHLKRELTSIENADSGTAEEESDYKNLLVETIHQCAVKFPNVGQSVVEVLLDFLSDQGSTAKDVIVFVREFVDTHENLRQTVVEKLLQNIAEIRDPGVYRIALWIMSEYAESVDEIDEALKIIFEEVGALPLTDAVKMEVEEDKDEGENKSEEPIYHTRTVIGPAGNYIQETVQINASTATDDKEEDMPNLRRYLVTGKGQYFLAVSLCQALTKMILRLGEKKVENSTLNNFTARALLLMTSIIRVGEMDNTPLPIQLDFKDSILNNIRTLLNPTDLHREVLLKKTRKALSSMLENTREDDDAAEIKQEESDIVADVDEVLVFRQLKGNSGAILDDEAFGTDITKAVGNSAKGSGLKHRLERVLQLTGFSDPIYAEACVSVHQFDIELDILIINQTKNTLQNVTLELQTSGDLKLVEKPEPVVLTARQSERLKASIKVSSTEAGVIFGNIVYDTTGASTDHEKIVVMESVHMDVRDYINPASMSNSKFSDMWAEFEWENKVPVSTDIENAEEYLQHIIDITNMKCLTPTTNLSRMQSSGQFLAANLYAKSIFGEDALINLSIEVSGSALSGYIRIRSKTQGIALSLGDKINAEQRKGKIIRGSKATEI